MGPGTVFTCPHTGRFRTQPLAWPVTLSAAGGEIYGVSLEVKSKRGFGNLIIF